MLGDVAELLRRGRKASGLSQEDAARAAKVSPRALTNWETGKVSPQIDDFLRLLSVYGIKTLDDLCRFVAGERIEQRESEIRELRPTRDSTYYRAMAEMTERLERLEGIIAEERKR